jgi:hypothetical protein
MLIVIDQLGRGAIPQPPRMRRAVREKIKPLLETVNTNMCQPITIGLRRLRHRACKEAAVPPPLRFCVPAGPMPSWGQALRGAHRTPTLDDLRDRRVSASCPARVLRSPLVRFPSRALISSGPPEGLSASAPTRLAALGRLLGT